MPTATRTPTSTRTVVRTRTPTSRPAPSAAVVIGGDAYFQAGAGPGRNSFRPDLAIDPTRIEETARWTAAAGDALFRAQLAPHPAGLRLVTQHGPAGGYDGWRRLFRDHQAPYVTWLMNLAGGVLDTAGAPWSWTATMEGQWLAFWQHPRLANYTIGRYLDGGRAALNIWGATANLLSVTSVDDRYSETVGPVVISLRRRALCTMNRRAWHGGSAAYVECEDLDSPKVWSLWRGTPWAQGQAEQDDLRDGGVAIAEGADAVVATLNFNRPNREAEKGLRIWPLRGDRLSRCSVVGGSFGAPAVAPDGVTVYVVGRDGMHLLEVDAATCAVREVPLSTGITSSQWPSPPIVTDRHVITIEPSLNSRADHRGQGDLVAYDRTTLTPAWRVDAGILSHLDPLSGWSRTDDFWGQADARTLFFAGRDALRAVRHADGAVLPWIWTADNAPEGFLNPQLFVDGDRAGVVVQNTWQWRIWPFCEEQLCPDGRPVNGVDYTRCCVGVTKKCEEIDCAKCERTIGWCPHHPERRRMLYPSDSLYVLEARP